MRADKTQAREFVFVDGGVTMYNNPAFQMFLMATVDRYWAHGAAASKGWKTGSDQMLIVSVGTGTSPAVLGQAGPRRHDEPALQRPDHPVRPDVRGARPSRTSSAAFRRVPGRRPDRPGGRRPARLRRAAGTGRQAVLLRPLRCRVDGGGARPILGCRDVPPKRVQQMDAVSAIGDMRKVGQAVARKKVELERIAGQSAAG